MTGVDAVRPLSAIVVGEKEGEKTCNAAERLPSEVARYFETIASADLHKSGWLSAPTHRRLTDHVTSPTVIDSDCKPIHDEPASAAAEWHFASGSLRSTIGGQIPAISAFSAAKSRQAAGTLSS